MDKYPILEAFGRHLTQLRKERKLSIHQLANACDMEYSHLQRIEKGKVNLELTTIVAIAQGLNMPAKELLPEFQTPQ